MLRKIEEELDKRPTETLHYGSPDLIGGVGKGGLNMIKGFKSIFKWMFGASKAKNLVTQGFVIEGTLSQIFSNKKYFLNWIKGNQSLSRIDNPLNAVEAQQLIDQANKLGIIMITIGRVYKDWK